MLYDKKIKYLDYYEGGTKVNGGGFAKLEVRDNTLRIELTIRGLHPTDSFERDVALQGVEKEEILGQIRIQNGCGQFRYSCDADREIGATGILYSELRGIRIPIGGTREILCQWDNVSNKRRINLPEENSPKTKLSLHESKRESLAESYTGIKADSEVLVYAENEQIHKLKSGKREEAEEREKEVKKEKYASIEEKNKENKDRENNDRERQEDKNKGDKDRERQEDKNKEGKDRERQENRNIEGKDRERQENRNIEDKDRERQENKNIENNDQERQEGKNREGKESIKENIENKENKERDNKESKTKETDGKLGTQPGPTEMQAQGATKVSDKTSSQFPEKNLQPVLQSEEQSGDRAKDKPDIAGKNRAEHPDVRKAPVKLMEDKWQQLSAIYPHIQPFRDERDYLSLTPSDFVLFPDRFYRAVNNSFLLHGYYNYHHLILARIERRGEILYYIGVPGNYFEREKQVAIMFGFESFECETEPAKTGDFGYYMMRTEL